MQDESSVQIVKKVKSFGDAVNLIWRQTSPLFVQPHLSNLIIVSVAAFFIIFVSQSFEVWYVYASFLAKGKQLICFLIGTLKL